MNGSTVTCMLFACMLLLVNPYLYASVCISFAVGHCHGPPAGAVAVAHRVSVDFLSRCYVAEQHRKKSSFLFACFWVFLGKKKGMSRDCTAEVKFLYTPRQR